MFSVFWRETRGMGEVKEEKVRTHISGPCVFAAFGFLTFFFAVTRKVGLPNNPPPIVGDFRSDCRPRKTQSRLSPAILEFSESKSIVGKTEKPESIVEKSILAEVDYQCYGGPTPG